MPLPDSSTWELCWARGGIDQAKVGVFAAQGVSPVGDYAVSTAALPDIVLAAGSYVTLQRLSPDVTIDVTLQNIGVAYTVGAGPVSSVDSQGIPLLTPTDNS